MKKIKCYGRAKTNKLDSSKNQAVFDSDSNTVKSLGVDPQEKNKPPEPELSDLQLFASFCQEPLNQSSFFSQSYKKGYKKRKLMARPAKRVSIYLRRLQRFNVSNRSNISLLNNCSSTAKTVLKKASNNTNTSRSSKFQRKCKKGTGIARSKIKLRNRNCSKKLTGQKLPRKNNEENEPLNDLNEISPVSNEPHWSSIFEHSLNIENQYKRWETNAFLKKKSKKSLDGSVRLSDVYHIPSPLESDTGEIVSHNLPSVQEAHGEIHSSTSVSNQQSSHKPLPIHTIFNNIRLNSSNIATSTPLRSNKKTCDMFVSQFNVSGICKSKGAHGLGSSDLLCSINTPVLSSSIEMTNITSTSKLDQDKSLIPETVLEDKQNIINNIDMNVMNLNALQSNSAVVVNRSLAHRNILQTSKLSTSWHKSSRSCEVHSTSEKSALKNESLQRSFRSSDQVNSFCPDVECNISKLLEHCEQDSVIEFKDVFDWSHTTVRKIGEGTYGEVFIITQKKSSSVIKVIPFSEKNNDHSMQTIETVYSELKVAHCLSELRTDENNQTKNFNKLKSAKIVKGNYPSKMLVAWDTFSDAKTTYNDRPDVFDEQQKFAILELEYGGKDMSEFVMRNAAEAECIFKQIVISLAIAEEAYLFEHRDLHLGNILVQRNNSKKISYILRGKHISIQNEGLVVTIIDFTLSRVLESGCVFYNDLANDESLFNQSGDYQFQVYKQTRECLNNEWQKSVLYSNVLWLTFLCVKTLKYEYSRPKSKKHLEGMKNIQVIQKKLPDCKSALDVFLFLHIVENIPKRSHIQSSRLSRTTKFFDRNSLQKANIGN